MKIIQLHHYIKDSANLFDQVAHLPWSQFLDSGVSCLADKPVSTSKGTDNDIEGVDIMVCEPQEILLTYGDETEHYGSAIKSGARSLLSSNSQNPFSLLKERLCQNVIAEEEYAKHQLPFWGGAVGYFGYELAHNLDILSSHAQDDIGLPDMAIGMYEVAVITCHRQQKSWLLDVTGENYELRKFWLEKINSIDHSKSRLIDISDAWVSTGLLREALSRDEYHQRFKKVQSYLQEGDCYQVNLTNRFDTPVVGDAWQSYLKMRSMSSAPFGAFMNFPFARVLSNSPEQFIESVEGNIQTKPIKGSRPRDLITKSKDDELAKELEHSTKDQAENVMIVDLLRNDLGKVSETGSVSVPELFSVETYANVHHLVSKVTGRLKLNYHVTDLLAACFPGGSITGAPKKRAMEVIDELEKYTRGVYCGAIGWIDYAGNMQTNIAIRTMTYSHGRVYFSAGGGIVIDSNEEDEYQELMNKATIMRKTLGLED